MSSQENKRIIIRVNWPMLELKQKHCQSRIKLSWNKAYFILRSSWLEPLAAEYLWSGCTTWVRTWLIEKINDMETADLSHGKGKTSAPIFKTSIDAVEIGVKENSTWNCKTKCNMHCQDSSRVRLFDTKNEYYSMYITDTSAKVYMKSHWRKGRHTS